MTQEEKYKINEEKKLSILLNKLLQKQEKRLWKLIESFDTKSVENDIESEVETYTEELLAILLVYVWKVMTVWFKTTKVKFKEKLPKDFNIDFKNTSSLAAKYISKLEKLHLSDYKWSISKTTNKRIKKLIENWLKEWLSYTEIWSQISKLDPVVFSKSRWELIATTEIGRAYEYWKMIPVKKLSDSWYEMVKRCLTAWDDKVRPDHVINWDAWFIPFNDLYPWTLTSFATTWFWCRCADEYKYKAEIEK